jgi:F-type H+-transporting ATPase subunit epsilon
MKLIVRLPAEVFLEEEVESVSAEGPQGSFTLKPKHIDLLSTLAPGILHYEQGGVEHFIAVDAGVLVKSADSVHVAVRRAVSGSLGELEGRVTEMLEQSEEREREVMTASARMEADFIRGIIGFGPGREGL